MRRLLLLLTGMTLLLGALSSTALARGHRGRGHRSAAHHQRLRHERFGTSRAADGSSTPASTTSSSPSSSTAGTITSFSDGRLTLTLNDGSTVSGLVTSGTRIECAAPEQGSGDAEGGDMHRSGDDGPGDARGDDQGGNQGGNQGDDQGDEHGGNDPSGGSDGQGTCSSADLTPGRTVNEAELAISNAGSNWTRVELAS